VQQIVEYALQFSTLAIVEMFKIGDYSLSNVYAIIKSDVLY